MRKFLVFSFMLITFLYLTSCSEEDSITEQESIDVTLNKSSGPSANGSGVLTFEGKKQSFSFHAREKNGVVTGSVQLNARNLANGKAHGRIDCMVINGNVATISGEFTSGAIDLGDGVDRPYFFFQVQDNGEGSKNPTDGFSDIFAADVDVFPCDFVSNFDLISYKIENGNFQVKP